MRKAYLTLFGVLAFALLNAQNTVNSSIPFSWGARIGFAATQTYLLDAYMDGHKIEDYSQDTPVGNFAALQFKWNFNKFLIQSGAGLGFNKSTFIADRNSWDPNATSSNNMSCTYSMISLMVPVQIGVNVVNKAPYCLSVFTGPRFRYAPVKHQESDFINTSPYVFSENLNEFPIGITGGLSIQSGRTFLDFEYEYIITNLSSKLTDTSGVADIPRYSLNRNTGIMSFSFGYMF